MQLSTKCWFPYGYFQCTGLVVLLAVFSSAEPPSSYGAPSSGYGAPASDYGNFRVF